MSTFVGRKYSLFYRSGKEFEKKKKRNRNSAILMRLDHSFQSAGYEYILENDTEETK